MTFWERMIHKVNRITNKATSIKVTYIAKGQFGFELSCNYWANYYEVDDTGVPIHQNQPKLGCLLEDFSIKPQLGDEVIIKHSVYKVASVEIDEAYYTADLFLQKA